MERLPNPLIEDWKAKFDRVFEFHPDREAIMTKILSDEPISLGLVDKWFREADECADAQRNIELQQMAGEAA